MIDSLTAKTGHPNNRNPEGRQPSCTAEQVTAALENALCQGTSFGAPTLTFPQLALRQETRKSAEYRAATVLARAGFVNDAAWYLRRLLAERGDRGLALLAARASADAGDYASVTRILVNHFAQFLAQPASGLPRDFWTLVYPRPFWDEVRRAGATHGVDPLLLVSLMRQEYARVVCR